MAMTKLKEGMKAPAFSGKNQNGEIISSKDLLGKKVVLYFYPKDNTPGCTAEACDLNDNYLEFKGKGFEIVGVSPDGEASHRKFIEKFDLKFNLIADTDQNIMKDFDVWGEKSMYGKTYMGVNRTTFVIDEQGVISNVFTKVDTKNHTDQIFKALKL
jgi:thioredoxin-dependent peroxiredoxin